jgi:hypothetical protein
MSIVLKLLHLFDNKKDRTYISETGRFLSKFDNKHPKRSQSQKIESAKHRSIFSRKKKHTL